MFDYYASFGGGYASQQFGVYDVFRCLIATKFSLIWKKDVDTNKSLVEIEYYISFPVYFLFSPKKYSD